MAVDSGKAPNNNRYLVKSLVHASTVLEAFQSAGDVLRLRDVVARTGFNKAIPVTLVRIERQPMQ